VIRGEQLLDNWRFYPDAALALECWAHRQGNSIKLIESFTSRRKQEIWNDCVMIFSKSKNCCRNSQEKLADKFLDSYNIRSLLSSTIENFCEETEDRILLRQNAETMQAQLADRKRYLAAAERNAAIHAATAQAIALHCGLFADVATIGFYHDEPMLSYQERLLGRSLIIFAT
jgi:hypothetical protein